MFSPLQLQQSMCAWGRSVVFQPVAQLTRESPLVITTEPILERKTSTARDVLPQIQYKDTGPERGTTLHHGRYRNGVDLRRYATGEGPNDEGSNAANISGVTSRPRLAPSERESTNVCYERSHFEIGHCARI